MVELVTEDVMDWARDLAALHKLFAGQSPTDPPINQQSVVLQFTPHQPMVNSAIDSTDDVVCSSSASIAPIKSGID